MLESDLTLTIAKLVERLLLLASEDRELRSHLRALALHVLGAIGPVEAPAEGTPPVVAQTADAGAMPATPAAPRPRPVAPSPEILEGLQAAVHSMTSAAPAQPSSSAPVPRRPEVTDSDLPLIEARCKLKAEGVRWAAKRRLLHASGADHQTDIAPLDRDIIERAREQDCFLWMNSRDFPVPSDLGLMDDLVGCFDTTADAIALVRLLLADSGRTDAEFEQALNLLAEAQSALRAAVNGVHDRQDKDQLCTYQWLLGTCRRDDVYIERYMRINDEADPREWSSLGDRIQALDAQVQERQQHRRQHESALKRARFHATLLLKGDKGDHSRDWGILIEAVDKMVQDGTPPSSTDLRDLLLPVVEKVPEDLDLPPSVHLVMREIDRFLAERPAPQAEEQRVETAEEVKLVAKWLTGKVLVLIGGVPRPYAREALKRAFGLKEVDWVETQEHDSVAGFESHVAHTDVAVVLLAIRWTSHSFANVKQFCDSHGKPLVRLPAGYNPNQVAVQIAQQCGDRLEAGCGK